MVDWIRPSLTLVLALTLAGCDGSHAAPSLSINLTGTWSGVVGAGSGGGRALRVTWMATQSGVDISGPATLFTSPPVTNLAFVGALSGTLTGTQLSLSYFAPAGSLSDSANCSLSGSGSAATGNGTISGTLDVTFVSCDDLGLQPPVSDRLMLTKQ